MAKRQRPNVLNSPSVTTTGILTSRRSPGSMSGTMYSMLDRPGGLRYFCRALRFTGGVEFEFWAIPAQPVLANLIGARMKIRDDDSGVVPSSAADDLATGEGIDSTEAGLER